MHVIWEIGVLQLKKVQVSSTHVNWHLILLDQDIEIMTALRIIITLIPNGRNVSVTQMAVMSPLVSFSIPIFLSIHPKLNFK